MDPGVEFWVGFVRVVRPAYYLELQRISGGWCGGDFLIKWNAKVLKEINKCSCITTVALISYVEKSVFYLLRKITRNCIKENITVQRSCSWRSVMITNGVFSVDKGEYREGDCAEGKRSSFNVPLEVVISCWYRTSSWTSNWKMNQWFFCPIITEATLNKIVVDIIPNVHRREGKRERLKVRDRRETHTVAGEFLPTIEWVKRWIIR